MLIPGEISIEGSSYSARIEAIGAHGSGPTRRAACDALAEMVLEIARAQRPLDGFEVDITDDGESTLYLTSNDPTRLVSLLLRQQRTAHGMSLADVADTVGAKSKNAYATYEQGRTEPSIGKLQELLVLVAPDYRLAIIPRSAAIIPRHEERELEELDAPPEPKEPDPDR